VLPLPLAGEGWGGGVSAEGFPKRREPSPAALGTMLRIVRRVDLSRKRERLSTPAAILRDARLRRALRMRSRFAVRY